ncbi:hypothetical protein MMF93_29250 [Streptomyces tubbatahanensis]|uniref:HTH iclR-type domain-containing protein n=1 Tax=Streptomyces tubbatahanensis TaxID=2923272 RepID=A0ABY3Y0B4_9ACTN|nr:hypothetical protein [Streptomyces tubbatahanensis]UNT00087.1 hypothetical protein MMF93_29250 [Streptomyces tubbatahanensis]
MSKRQRGRRHRQVNRTPRPVGPAVRVTATREAAVPAARPRTPAAAPTTTGAPPAAVPEPARAGDTAPGPQAARPQATVAGPATPPERRLPSPEPASAPDCDPMGAAPSESATVPAPAHAPESLGVLFRTPARDGGLGQSAARTWQEVKEAGADGLTVEELSARVGYQSRTIAKHLLGLAEHGVVEQHAPDRWRPVSPHADPGDGPPAAAAQAATTDRVPQHA